MLRYPGQEIWGDLTLESMRLRSELKSVGRLLAIFACWDNMQKLSCDQADQGGYVETFGLSTSMRIICRNFLSNKIVSLHIRVQAK